MEVLDVLKDDLLIITPNKRKEVILKQLYHSKKNYNLKFMTLDELKRNFLFDYDLNAIFYLMEKYHYKVDVCKVYLKNMYYLEDKKYSSLKLNELLNLKNELLENKLLKKNPVFLEYLKQKEVLVFGYSLDKFDRNLLSKIENMTKVTIVEDEVQEEKELTIYALDTMEKEVDFVATKILELIKKGVSLSQVKLTNVNEEYHDSIKRVFDFYHLPIILPSESIYSTIVIQDFLSILNGNKNLEESFEIIKEKYEKEEDVIQKLLNCCNEVIEFTTSFEIMEKILIDLLKNTTFKTEKRTNSIEIISFDELIPNDDDHIFVMGMNQNILPKLYKDEDYISDSLKQEVLLSLTSEKNKQEKENVKNKLYSISNLIITYKKRSSKEEYYKSSLLDEMNVTIIENPEYNEYRYSNLYNKIKLAKKLDRFIKYQEREQGLVVLYQNYPDLAYQTYQNQFTGINNCDYLEFIHHSLLLSYTSMNEYNLCGFRYYLNRVLKLGNMEDTFPIFVGNLYHKILSIAFLPQFDFEEAFMEYLKERDLSIQEVFFLKKLKEELRNILLIIKEHQGLTSFRKELYEKEIFVPIKKKIKVLFKGTIDKIMYKESLNQEYIALIDYKSGGVHTSISNMIYGIDMQLPIYLYLMKHSNLFSNPKFTGFYFQKILHPEVTRKIGSTVMDQNRDRLKLQGYTIDQEAIVEQFDETYQDSTMIKGMKITSKGFAHYTKVVSEEDLDALIKLTEEQINKTIDNIIQANFSINPKRIGKENVSCTYCPYQDICYHTEKDLVYLKEYSGLDFLGGEING